MFQVRFVPAKLRCKVRADEPSRSLFPAFSQGVSKGSLAISINFGKSTFLRIHTKREEKVRSRFQLRERPSLWHPRPSLTFLWVCSAQDLLCQLIWSVHSRWHKTAVNLTASLEAQVRTLAERTLKYHQVPFVTYTDRNSQHSPSCPFLPTIPTLTSTTEQQYTWVERGTKATSASLKACKVCHRTLKGLGRAPGHAEDLQHACEGLGP